MIHANDEKAFTLIEMIVSLAIFSVVAVIALGALVRIVGANQKAQALQDAMTNVNFALEAMSREMRVGSNFRVDNTDPTDHTIVTFVSTRKGTDNSGNSCGLDNAYKFIKNSAGNYSLQKAESAICSPGGATNFTDMLSSRVIISSYFFNVSSDPYRLISIGLTGFAGAEDKNKTPFNIETMVSARTQ